MSTCNDANNTSMSLQTKLREYLSYPQWGFNPPRARSNRTLQHFGTEYGGYRLDPSLINRESVIYSVGIGEDISFDLALIEQFGTVVEAFDPTPKVKEWLADQKLPEQFHFHRQGIADFDGEAAFYLPAQEDWVSHSIVAAQQYSRKSTQVPMKRLKSVMQELGHGSIDVLKMDIEGAEYGVLEDLIREKIPVRQLLVEFHHRLSSFGTEKTKHILAMLKDYGMQICYVCPRLEVFTLIQMPKET
jgi:FkbM family methyltransferase